MPLQQTTQATQTPLHIQSSFASNGVWRQGKLIVLRRGAVLPERCLQTNAAVSGPRKEVTLVWYPPWLWILLAFNWAILLIVALFVRKSVTLEIVVSQEMIRRRNRFYLVGAALTMSGMVEFLIGAFKAGGIGFQMVIGFIVFFAGLFVAAIGRQVLIVQKIEGDYIWLRGASPVYLSGLTEWQGVPPS